MKHHSSWVSQTPWEDINPAVPLQTYNADGNEDSFGFQLLAQSIFWLSPKLCELDGSKMSVLTLQHWKQRQEYVNCQPDLSQTSQTRHTIRHSPTFIARHLCQGNNRVSQAQSILQLPLRTLWLKTRSTPSMCYINARITN